MAATFYNPVRIFFGEHSLSRLPTLLADKSVLLVCSKGAKARGFTAEVERYCSSDLHIVDSVPNHTDISYIGEIHRTIAATSFDIVVAIGGGSVLDTAKLLSIRGDTAQLQESIRTACKHDFQFRPLIAIPTTAGSGSDVTPWATVWERESHSKYSLHLPTLFPQATFIRPAFCASVSDKQLIYSACDALSHSFEALWNTHANPVSDQLAKDAIETIVRCLPSLMEQRNNTLLTSLSLAALQAGLAFSNTKTALAHAISYPLTLLHDLPHGLACSFTLPAILRSVTSEAPDFINKLPTSIGSAVALERFFEVLQIETAPAAYGISQKTVTTMQEAVLGHCRSQNFAFDTRRAFDTIFCNI